MGAAFTLVAILGGACALVWPLQRWGGGPRL